MKTLFAFLGGAIAGAAVAILMAPEKGEVTRAKIREMIDKRVDELEDDVQSVRIRANKAAKEVIESAANAVKR